MSGRGVKARLATHNKTGAEELGPPGLNRIVQTTHEVREALAVLQVRLDTMPKRKDLRALHADADEVIRRVVALLEQLEST